MEISKFNCEIHTAMPSRLVLNEIFVAANPICNANGQLRTKI